MKELGTGEEQEWCIWKLPLGWGRSTHIPLVKAHHMANANVQDCTKKYSLATRGIIMTQQQSSMYNPIQKGGSNQFSSVAQLCPTLCNRMDYSAPASLSIANSRSLLKLMSTESGIPLSHLILCHPLLLLPSIFPSIRVFSNESVLPIRWPKYCSVSTSVLPMNSQDWFPLVWTGWISLQSKGFSRVFSNTKVQKHQFLGAQVSL